MQEHLIRMLYDHSRQVLMKNSLQRIADIPNLSTDVREIVGKALANTQ